MKIKNVAVVFQNNIQYESFKNAVDLMIQRNINVDIFIPINNNDDGFTEMFEEFYQNISKSDYNIFRKPTKKNYDILFLTYEIPQFMNLKRKYTIKYMYGLSSKPNYSMSLNINYIFDAFLCYGNEDAKILNNYGITFQIGNIKYLNTKTRKTRKRKKTILYLPTYSNDSSIEIIGKELIKLKEKYNIIIKAHHGTEFLNNDLERNRRIFLKENFDNIYSSKTKLIELLNECDVVITDMSGAVFDALCLNKAIVMYCSEEKCKYGEYTSLCTKYAKSGHLVSFDKLNNTNLDNLIKKATTLEQRKKEKELFDILFVCKNDESDAKFIDFLNKIENNYIDEDYLKVHNQIKLEINNLLQQINENNNLTIAINELKNQNNETNNKLYKKEEKIKSLENQNNILNEKINNIYNSNYWKIISVMIKIKSKLIRK